MRIISLVTLICLSMIKAYGQDDHYKIYNGYVRIYEDRMMSQLTFSFEDEYIDFINALEKEFGQAELIHNWYVWKNIKVNDWSKKRCILRVQVSIFKVIELDKSESESREIHITLETRKGDDLLGEATTAHPIVRKYFSDLIDKTFLKHK